MSEADQTGYGRKKLVCLIFKGWLTENAVINMLCSKILKLTLTSTAASSQKVREMIRRPGKLERPVQTPPSKKPVILNY